MQPSPAPFERQPGAAARALPPSYQRREPAKTALYQIVTDNLEQFLADARERTEHGAGYPRFVERELERFLECGLLRNGFVRVRCASCADEKLVAFSCKGRGVCPSCTSRRMADAAAHLVDNVLPPAPYRQWVISFPRRVRFLLARDHRLLSNVLGLYLRKIFAWQRRRARRLGVEEPMCGAVTFCQRFGSLLNLNCHFHSILPDGVFTAVGDEVQLVPLPPPWPDDLDRLLRQIARATEALIGRRITDESADDAPDLLAHEQARTIQTTLFPSGAAPNSERSRRRVAAVAGYSLHADRFVDTGDRDALERLCRYGARAPIANTRLSIDDSGNAVLALRRPLRDGRTQLTFTPRELLRRLATLIPPPRKNLTRYHGVFAPAHPFRSAVVPAGRAPEQPDRPTQPDDPKPATTNRLPWAQLLRRTFAIDVLRCTRCAQPMTIIAVIPQSPAADAILDHLGLETADPRATGPPVTRAPA